MKRRLRTTEAGPDSLHNEKRDRRLLRGVAAAVVFLACGSVQILWADSPDGEQNEAKNCFAGPIQSLPNRPTVSNPADTTQCGVAELEYGWERDWPGAGARNSGLGSLVRFGLTRNLEFRWGMDNFLSQWDGFGAVQEGMGDQWLGAKYRFFKRSGVVPTLAVNYAVKVPSASYQKGLGSGRVDHEFTLLASQDIRGFHWDFNTNVFVDGRPSTRGRDHNVELAWAISHSLRGPLQIAGEVHGDSGANLDTPGFLATLLALSYQVSPRLVLDSGLDVGLTAGANRKRLMIGFTYSLTNLYSAGRRSRNRMISKAYIK